MSMNHFQASNTQMMRVAVNKSPHGRLGRQKARTLGGLNSELSASCWAQNAHHQLNFQIKAKIEQLIRGYGVFTGKVAHSDFSPHTSMITSPYHYSIHPHCAETWAQILAAEPWWYHASKLCMQAFCYRAGKLTVTSEENTLQLFIRLLNAPAFVFVRRRTAFLFWIANHLETAGKLRPRFSGQISHFYHGFDKHDSAHQPDVRYNL